jgi:hypothetical protein
VQKGLFLPAPMKAADSFAVEPLHILLLRGEVTALSSGDW